MNCDFLSFCLSYSTPFKIIYQTQRMGIELKTYIFKLNFTTRDESSSYSKENEINHVNLTQQCTIG